MVGAAALTGIPAQAVPTDESEALGTFLGGEAAGINLDDIAEVQGALAEYPSGSELETNPLAADVLNAVAVDLGGGLSLLGENGLIELGAVNQYAAADVDGAAAASGAVSDQGAIEAGGSAAFPSDASVSLTPLLADAGLDGVLSELDLQLGALSSQAEWPGGGDPVGDYQIAGATLAIDSPAVSDIATLVDDEIVPAVDGSVDELVGPDGLLSDALGTIGVLDPVLAALGSNLTVDSAITLDTEAALAPVLDEDFGDEGVVINVGAGTIDVDLDTILGGEGSLNDFDPNTEVLSADALAAITAGLSAALDDLTLALVDAVETALQSASLTFTAEGSILGGLTALDISLDSTVGDVVNGTVDSGDASLTISLAGLPVTLPLGDLTNALAGPLNDVLFDEDTGLVSTLAGTINTAVVGPTLAALSPALESLNTVVSLVANVQEQPGELPAHDPTGTESFTQRALTLTLLPGGTPLAQVDLASSTVRAVEVLDLAVTVTPDTAAPGDTVTVDGTGYTPDSTATVEIRDTDGAVIASVPDVPTDADGNFSTPVEIPGDAAEGDYTAAGIDDTTGQEADAPLTIAEVVLPLEVTVTPDTAAPGDTVTVDGTGYTPDSTATVEIRDTDGNVIETIEDVVTDSDGSFTTDVTIPDGTPEGDYTAAGIDDTTGQEADAPLTIAEVVLPLEVTVTPDTAAPGDTVTVDGTGYTPDSTATVEIRDTDGAIIASVPDVPTDADGNFSTPVEIPGDAAEGDYTAAGIDDTTGQEADAPLTIAEVVLPLEVTVTPDTAAPGDTVTVDGTGYTPDSTATVEIRDTDGNVIETIEDVVTDSDGSFTTDVTIPDGTPEGDYTAAGIDDTTGQEADAPLTIDGGLGGEEPGEETITVEPDTAGPGDDVTVDGEQWPPNTTVTVELVDPDGDVVVTVEVETDENGDFTTPITVPDDAEAGDYVVEASDENENSAEDDLVIETDGAGDGADRELAAEFSKDQVQRGEEQVFTASGFEPGEEVQARINSEPLNLTVQTADDDGTVSWTFVVPADFEVGPHTGTATSVDVGDSVVASFEVYLTTTGQVGGSDGGGDGGDDGTATGGSPTMSGGGGTLPRTGSEIATYLALAFLLTGAGAVALRVSRRRPQSVISEV